MPDRSPQPEQVTSNEVLLSPRGWLVAAVILAAVFHYVPRLWERVEPLRAGADYRVPFRLGNDYWVFSRWCREACAREDQTLVIGDSVVWGHYVATDETLPHYLSQLAKGRRFANLGVDGVHPLALAGLVEYYGQDIRNRNVILHCNLLWMSSRESDLQTTKERPINHPRLIPQFTPNVPCYRESLSGRLGIVVERNVPFFGWANHLRIAYFDNANLPGWTLDHPYENPAAAVTLELPSPDEPPSPEPVAKPWTEQGLPRFAPTWVELSTSLQWQALKRTIEVLRARGNRVFVLIGPFNEHMLKPESLAAYQERKGQVAAWLREDNVPHFIAPVLPSDEYADASHPLAAGYARLAEGLLRSEAFVRFSGPHR